MPDSLSTAEARRVALAAQGFAKPRPPKVTKRHAKQVMATTGALQIDSVSVVARAHYMPLYSRLGPYDMALLDRIAYRDHEWFEYWAHAACLLPVDRYPLSAARMKRFRDQVPGHKWWGWWATTDGKKLVRRTLADLRDRGPLSAGELTDPGEKPKEGWGWRYTPGKRALEYLFAAGRVAATRKPSFERVYDLPERVIPAEAFSAPERSFDEAHRECVRLAVGALGVGTVAHIKDYFRVDSVAATRTALRELVEAGEVVPVEVECFSQPAYMSVGTTVPKRLDGASLLSPFDPVMWHRDRVMELFGFEYTIEIYVPQAKRRYGYYTLPFRSGDRLVARADLKAERDAGVLRVNGAWSEQDITSEDVDALRSELVTYAGFLGLDEVSVGRKGDLASKLR